MLFKIKYENTLRYLMHDCDEQKRITAMQNWIASCKTEDQLNCCRIAIGIMFDNEQTALILLEWCAACQKIRYGKAWAVNRDGEIIEDGNDPIQLIH